MLRNKLQDMEVQYINEYENQKKINQNKVMEDQLKKYEAQILEYQEIISKTKSENDAIEDEFKTTKNKLENEVAIKN